MSNKFDIYSDMRVPFDVSTWARMHKFSTEAVNLTRALRKHQALEAQMESIQKQIDANTDEIHTAVSSVKTKMEGSDRA
jgi:hypothetical protein